MKSDLNKRNPQDTQPTYPCLKQYIHKLANTNFIVLFNKPLTGTVVWVDEESLKNTGFNNVLGEYRTDWWETQFKFINETVTISND